MSIFQPRITVLLFVLILRLAAGVGGSVYAQHMPGVQWKQRETEWFIIIYPAELSEDAGRLAAELDSIVQEASEGTG